MGFPSHPQTATEGAAMLVTSREMHFGQTASTCEPGALRVLTDEELRAAHHRAQIDCVLNNSASFMTRLNEIERELLSRRLPCR